ncbi:MAG: DNA repair exonuclease [Eubacteriaceae bacterium]|nr:DNA repair exonuclease [Eubacteriaceae bacterium]
MPLNIMHLADTHIGMKYSGYPEQVRKKLINARLGSVKRAVKIANEENCHLMVISGDLFERVNVSKLEIHETAAVLKEFTGDYILLLPGNHDYLNDSTDLWNEFSKCQIDNLILLKDSKIYEIDAGGMELCIYSAPCDKKHSTVNNLDWIKYLERPVSSKFNVLIAHGAIKEISPDLDNRYFNMSLQEILSLNMDLSLLGHTHVPYPGNDQVYNEKIFNPGTSEPDGMDYKYRGSVWLIHVEDDHSTIARRVETGEYEFLDEKVAVEDEESFEKIIQRFLMKDKEKTLLRLSLEGSVDRELYENREQYFRRLRDEFIHFEVDDSKLQPRFTREMVSQEFSEGSLPRILLDSLFEEGDEETAFLAYEMIKDVK